MTRTWTPPTPNGWWPQLHVVGDRVFLAWGNAEVWLAEFRWTAADGLALVRQQLIDGGAWSGQWIRPGILTYFSQATGRWEVDATAADWVPAKTADDPALVRGNQFRAAGGHWVSWLADPANPGRLTYDGQVLGVRMGPGVVAGDWLAASDSYPDPNNAIQTWKAGKPRTVHPCMVPLNGLSVGPDGHLAYGFVDLAFIDPSGVNQRNSCTPWRTEGVGPIVRHPDGTTWVTTVTWNDATGFVAVLLRPWPDGGMPGKHCLVIEVPAVHVSILAFGDQWLLATNDDKGRGLLQAVPQNTPLQVVKPRVPDLGQKWLGYYYAVGRYGDYAPAQNCTVVGIGDFADGGGQLPGSAPARMRAAAAQAGQAFIGTSLDDLDAMRDRWDLVAGLVLGEHLTTADIEAEATVARARMAGRGLAARPIVATITPDQVFRPDWRLPANVDALAVEVYFDGPAATWFDMLRAVDNRVTQLLRFTDNLPVILVPQCYDRNRNPVWMDAIGQESLEAISAGCLVNLERPTVIGCWWFAYGRPGGVTTYRALEAWHQAAVGAARRPAGIPLRKPAAAPLEATISSYGPTSGEAPLTVRAVAQVTKGTADSFTWRWRPLGAAAWTVAAVNPASDPDHHFVFSQPGDYEISLRAGNQTSVVETGKQRLVHVAQPQRKEPPVPTKPDPKTVTLKTWNGHYVTAEDGGGHEGEFVFIGPKPKHGLPPSRPKGLLRARGTDGDLGDWQRFEVHAGREPGTVGFKVAGGGPWVTAEADGTLVANRQKPDDFVPEAWEAFRVVDAGGGKVGLKTDHGKFWCAEDGGGDVMHATRDDVGPWESFEPSAALLGAAAAGGGPLAARTGIVRAAGHCLVDDGGPFNAIGTSLFPLDHLFKFDRDRLKANLAKLKGRVHYVRKFGVVGGGSWEDRALDPRWPDWADNLAAAVDLTYDDFGIRTHLTVFAGLDGLPTRADRDRVIDQVVAIVNARPHKFISGEVMNEAWQNGFQDKRDEARAHCRTLRAKTPILWAVTNPAEQADDQDGAKFGAEIDSWYADANASLVTNHPSRDQRGSGGLWRPVRQPWEMQFWPRVNGLVWAIDEPIGPRSSVAMDDDPERLIMAAVAAWVCGCPMYTLHTGAGVRLGGAADQGGGKFYLPREKNIYDVPGIDTILDGLVAMSQAMPADVANGARQNSNSKFPAHPFDTGLIGEDVILRAYASVVGDRFAVACIQVLTSAQLRAKRPMHVTVYQPVGGAVLFDGDLDAGQVVTVSGTKDQPRGYLVVGHYR